MKNTGDNLSIAMRFNNQTSLTESILSATDYLAWLRNITETIRQVREAHQQNNDKSDLEELERQLIQRLFDINCWDLFRKGLMEQVDEAGYVINRHYWQQLNAELIYAANLQHEMLDKKANHEDLFSTYADLYHEINGKRNFEFMSREIQFLHDTFQLNFATAKILSLGCGTGVMEEYILNTYHVTRDNLLGIDASEGMIREASKRINAKVQNIMDIESKGNQWDICFAIETVLQYLPQPLLEKAIKLIAQIIKPGGYFAGDFITPDHPIRAYPNVLHSEQVFLLRTPLIIEQEHNLFQQTKLINVSKLQGEFRVTYEGEHIRYLPSLCKLRYIFKKYFDRVNFFDAMTLASLDAEDDTSPSSRYLVVAQKGNF